MICTNSQSTVFEINILLYALLKWIKRSLMSLPSWTAEPNDRQTERTVTNLNSE